MLHKSIKAELKAEGNGEVVAVFSTFNTIDHDGDVTLPGAFTDGQKVRISAYNHTSWSGALPVGKGVIRQDDTQAYMDGQFFMNTTHGRDTFETVKEMDDLGEWSYGYDIIDGAPGLFEGRDVRLLRALKVHEVSPVLLGAGIGTHTVSAKAKDLGDDELAEQAKEACKALLARGIALPEELVKAVRETDATAADIKRRKDMLATIAAFHGIDTGGTH